MPKSITKSAAGPASESPPPIDVDSRAERLLRLIHWSSTASRQLRRQLAEVAATFDLTDNELLVVWLCRGTGWVQVELAGTIGVSPAQMSGTVDRLGSRGLVAMHRPTMDRRRQVWRTTGGGLALLERIAPRLEELAASLSGGLDAGEEPATEALYQRLAEAIGSGRAPPTKAELPDNENQQRACKEAA
jgi:DNA-binding MarR family transcriptional regulator